MTRGTGAGVDRRGVLSAGLAVAALGVAVASAWAWRPRRRLAYNVLPGLEPFRELVSDGGISAASLAFAGLQRDPAGDKSALEARVAAVRTDLCGALYPGAPKEAVPMAYFSDFNCPYCRVLEGELDEVLAEEGSGLAFSRHELPLLGGASLAAAKAVLAAERQGAYQAMKARLLRAGLVTDEPYLRAVGADLGLDPDRLLADMESPVVADQLLTSRALGQVFGFVGTPALVIGRTTVLGSVTAGTIRQVIADERAMPTPACDLR